VKRRILSAVVVTASCVTSLELSSTSQAVVTLPEDPYVFAPQLVMTSSPPHTFTISVSGSNDDYVLDSIAYSGAPCQDFTFNAPGVMGYELCGNQVSKIGCHSFYQFTVTFTPKNLNTSSCVLDISFADAVGSGSGSGTGTGCAAPPYTTGMGTSLHLSGSGIGPPYAMNVSPSTLNFGSVVLNVMSPAQTIDVDNVGTNSIMVNEMLVNTGEYQINPSAGFMLQPPPTNSSRQVTVSCKPTMAGAHDASITFTTSALEGNFSKPVTLHCQGVNTTLSESPNPIAFGDRFLGIGSAQQITLSNAGGSNMTTITISSITLEPGSSPDVTLSPPVLGSSIVLMPGSNATPVTVHYSAATQAAPGSLGTLVVTTNTSGDLTYPITGGAEPGSIASNPTTIDFGPVCIGGMVQRDLAMYASGDADVVMTGINDPGSPFSTGPASGTLRGHHNGETSITTKVAPTMMTMLGDQTGELDITTNLPMPDTVYKVPLTAKVLPPGIAPTPTEVHFGTVAVDSPTSGKMVTLTNCSGGTLTLSAAHIVEDPAEFVLVSTTDAMGQVAMFPFDLPDHTSATFTLIMAPHTQGHKQSHLEIDYTGSTALVPLDGDAGNLGSKDRETYYACAAGGSAGAVWPIGLALLALRRRRR
jgi:hypothetical protein